MLRSEVNALGSTNRDCAPAIFLIAWVEFRLDSEGETKVYCPLIDLSIHLGRILLCSGITNWGLCTQKYNDANRAKERPGLKTQAGRIVGLRFISFHSNWCLFRF